MKKSENYKYGVYHTKGEELIRYKFEKENGDIVETKIILIPTSIRFPEGVKYSCVYVRAGKRLIGYDNSEGNQQEPNHHKHIKDRIVPYDFVDVWRLLEDFNEDLEKIKRGVIQ
ncbi:MAG: DUF6516 family protein [Candidatus Woesearchaeota archaeon]|nr:DUF6516 family protein [Candidatus Woesearchaeota archaeon]